MRMYNYRYVSNNFICICTLEVTVSICYIRLCTNMLTVQCFEGGGTECMS